MLQELLATMKYAIASATARSGCPICPVAPFNGKMARGATPLLSLVSSVQKAHAMMGLLVDGWVLQEIAQRNPPPCANQLLQDSFPLIVGTNLRWRRKRALKYAAPYYQTECK